MYYCIVSLHHIVSYYIYIYITTFFFWNCTVYVNNIYIYIHIFPCISYMWSTYGVVDILVGLAMFLDQMEPFDQWIFQVPVKGGRDDIPP